MKANATRIFSVKSKIVFGLLFLILTACVTVNVNFPEGAVQKAADDYVQELYRAKEETKLDPDQTSQPTRSLLLFAVQNLLLPQAHAQAAVSTNFPEAKEIQAKQQARLKKIDEFKAQGIIGESKEGLLVLWPGESGAGKSKIEKKSLENKAKPLVEEENADRKKLYALVVQKNNMQSTYEEKIGAQFAEAFHKASAAGTWIESPSGAWVKK